MDEIIQILVFVVAILITVIQQNTKNKHKSQTIPPSDEEILEEVFPELKQETPPMQPKPMQKPAPRKKAAPPNRKKPSAPILPSTPVETEKKIRLNTREEARRAFIYSEIFNRKY